MQKVFHFKVFVWREHDILLCFWQFPIFYLSQHQVFTWCVHNWKSHFFSEILTGLSVVIDGSSMCYTLTMGRSHSNAIAKFLATLRSIAVLVLWLQLLRHWLTIRGIWCHATFTNKVIKSGHIHCCNVPGMATETSVFSSNLCGNDQPLKIHLSVIWQNNKAAKLT